MPDRLDSGVVGMYAPATSFFKEKTMKLTERLRTAIAIVSEGVNLWVDPPRIRKLKVTIDRGWYERRAAQREADKLAHPEIWDRHRKRAEGFAKQGLLQKPKNLRRYRLLVTHPQTGAQHDASVVIDIERRLIDWTYTSAWLFGEEHEGSGGIGLMLITLPTSALLSPYIFVRMRMYAAQEEREGMSRHGSALLEALGDQITADERLEMTDAFKSEWARQCLRRKKVTLAQADDLLRTLRLVERHASENEAMQYGDVAASDYRWFDEAGDCLAQGGIYGTRDHYVKVLGSVFEDEEADRLISCFAVREKTVNGKKRARA